MDRDGLASDMIGAASQIAGNAWAEIQSIAVHEFQALANRIADIELALGTGQMAQTTAKLLFRNARSQVVAVLALMSTIVAAAAEKIVKAALDMVKGLVNGAIGFKLIS